MLGVRRQKLYVQRCSHQRWSLLQGGWKIKHLIIGGSGFIGSNLTKKLTEAGHEVVILDLSPPPKDSIYKGVGFIKGDIRDYECIADLLSAHKFDTIFHLAAVVGVKKYIEQPLDVIDINIIGLRNVLKACLETSPPQRFLFASTSEIYGKNPKVPWEEDSDRVLGPTVVDRWVYSTSKAVCEHMLFAVSKRYSLPIVVLRPFNVYGPRQEPTNVIPRNMCRMLKGLSPIMYDSGMQVRCFTFIDDMVDALILASIRKKAVGGAINIGSAETVTIKDLLESMIKISDKNLKVKNISTKAKFGRSYEDIETRIPTVSLAEALLGWKARTDLQDGLKSTFDWYRENTWFWRDFDEKE